MSEALTELNQVLAGQELLTGFTTLFVGAYDGCVGTLDYVSCGQEPALIRRAGFWVIEEMLPTGPIMGALEGIRYKERHRSPGDAFAVFTDGLTEVGATQPAMLGIEGAV